MSKRVSFGLILGGALVLGALALGAPLFAQGPGPTPIPSGEDSYCLLCHAQPEPPTLALTDGSTLELRVDPATLAASVHGDPEDAPPLGCVDCHDQQAYPHQGALPADARAYRVAASARCVRCHEEQATGLADGVHYEALARGNWRAATCVDCHGAHDVQPPAEPRTRIAETCGNCHRAVFEQFRQSVHGVALFEEDDPNVPTCVDCHGVHGIAHPTTAQFRNRSPELCATCHADAELMAEYGISTNVFESYLTDFHGKTVALFEQQAEDVATNKAVCFDCHGVHDIAPVDAENSHVVRENLLATCRQCHPDATANFPDAWVGHYEPTPESQPLLFAVNTFYAILIPTVLGGFAVLIATDIFRRIRERVRNPRGEG